MSIAVKQPTESLDDNGLAIVLFNHLGSSIAQDTGRDAQFIADDLSVPVIAVDRPGTHGIVPSIGLARDLSTASGYMTWTARLGEEINEELDAIGAERSLVMGRSAAGVAALALTASGVIESQKSVFVAEPISCEQLDLNEAKRLFGEYGPIQQKLQDDNPEIIRSGEDGLPLNKRLSRLVHMAIDFYFDQFHNQYIFASDTSVQYMKQIAEMRTDIEAVIEFAEHSLVANPDVLAAIKTVESKRTVGADFIVRQSSNTTHASYDNRDYMSSVLRPILDSSLRG